MRILFVTPYVPSLIRVRPFNFIKHLSSRHSVTLVCLAQGDAAEEDAIEGLRECCDGVVAFPLSKMRSVSSCFRRLLSRMPLQAAYTCAPEVSELISSLSRARPFDVLHVEHIRGVHLAEGVRHIPRVFDSVDCITRLLKFRLEDLSSPVQRLIHFEELLKMRAYEPRMVDTFDRVVVSSRHDKRALDALLRRIVLDAPVEPGQQIQSQLCEPGEDRSHCDGRLAVVPNGVDCDYFRPMPLLGEPGTIVFSGRMSYYPNVSAVLWFYENVFPRIRASRPDTRFRIVGSRPPDAVRKLTRDPAVEVTGYVPDIRPSIASAAAVVCPLAVGVGIQNKVLEAMAMGKAVVASSVACKGIPGAEDGRHLVRADDPHDVADALLRIMDGSEYASRLGDGARRFVEDSYSWEAAVRVLEDVHAQAADMSKYRVPAAA